MLLNRFQRYGETLWTKRHVIYQRVDFPIWI